MTKPIYIQRRRNRKKKAEEKRMTEPFFFFEPQREIDRERSADIFGFLTGFLAGVAFMCVIRILARW